MDTYEKKYKEIVGQIKKVYLYAQTDSTKAVLEEIFPELSESEDEKVRKALAEMVHDTTGDELWVDYNVHKEEALAWLEKQGEKKVSYTTTVETGDGGINALVTRYIEIPFGAKDSELQEATYFIPKGYYAKVEGDKAVIKNDEQTPVNKVVQKFKIGDSIKTTNEEPLTITKIDDKGYWSEDLLVCDFDDAAKWELVEQKPADKVEPKFKVGDFIVNDYCMGKVIELTGDAYLLDTGQGIPFSCEHNAHLWTIADAKDGDVLSDGTTIFIFKDLLSDGSVMSYCDYDTDSGESDAFCPLSVNLMCSKITPATKEQRDLLFQKMHKAGYEWDAEKKELKKEAKEAMYDKPALSEEDEKQLNDII